MWTTFRNTQQPQHFTAINQTDLTEDFLWLGRRCGFRLIETLRLALSAMPGSRVGSAYKYEPVFAFRKV